MYMLWKVLETSYSQVFCVWRFDRFIIRCNNISEAAMWLEYGALSLRVCVWHYKLSCSLPICETCEGASAARTLGLAQALSLKLWFGGFSERHLKGRLRGWGHDGLVFRFMPKSLVTSTVHAYATHLFIAILGNTQSCWCSAKTCYARCSLTSYIPIKIPYSSPL